MAETMNATNHLSWAAYMTRRLMGDRKVPVAGREIKLGEVHRIGLPVEEYRALLKTGQDVIKLRRVYYGEEVPGSLMSVGDSLLVYGESDSALLSDGNGVTIVISDGEKFAVPIPVDLSPDALITKDGETMTRGLDFDASRGVLVFDEHPSKFFGDIIHIKSGWASEPDLFDYRDSATHTPQGHWIRDFFRHNQNVRAFRRAVAVQAGLVVLDREGVLLSKQGSVYVFDWGLLEVNYDHDPLIVDRYYERGTVVGPLEVYGGHGDWWNALDWPNGMPIGSLCNMGASVVAPFEMRRLEAVTHNGNVHPLLTLDGYDGEVDKFHKALWAGERRSGSFVCATLGLNDGDTLDVNPVDFFMRYGFGPSLLRFDIQGAHLVSRKNSILRFIQEHRPVGCRVMLQTNDG
jgi:hypothetical protein